jgi:hypothetical protein
MDFKDKYTVDAKEADKKLLVTNDSMLNAEMLYELTKELSMLRRKN